MPSTAWNTTSGVFDPDTSDNTATELTTVNTSANLSLTTSASPDPVLACNFIASTPTVTYTLSLHDALPILSDAIPAGTSFVSASGGGTLTAGVVGWNLTTITSGANKSVTLVVKVDSSRTTNISRSEERRVGEEERDRWDKSASGESRDNSAGHLACTESY